MPRSALLAHLTITGLLVTARWQGAAGYGCPYGRQRCSFDPAPPGQAPACAANGLTYCVHPDPYPDQVIRALVENGQYDIRTLLSDESRDDFGRSPPSSYGPPGHTPGSPYGYGPSSLPHVDQISLVTDAPLYVAKPVYNTKFETTYNQAFFTHKTPLAPPSPLAPPPYNRGRFVDSLNYTRAGSLRPQVATSYWSQNNIQLNAVPTPLINSVDSFDKSVYSNFPPNLADYRLKVQQRLNRPAESFAITPYNRLEWWRYVNPNSRSDVTVQQSISVPLLGHRNGSLPHQGNEVHNPHLRTNNEDIEPNNLQYGFNTIQPGLYDAPPGVQTVPFGLDAPQLSQHEVHEAHQHGRRRRNAQLVRAARQRQLTGADALRIALGLASAETESEERPRRQADGSTTQQLCGTRSEYITPRAALNNKGAWKYVVNMPSNMTQLVRAEICTSTECNGICSLPLGYTSRCEQKYVQKRLVALDSNGQSLYTDVFWIPSCCQCTIVNNN